MIVFMLLFSKDKHSLCSATCTTTVFNELKQLLCVLHPCQPASRLVCFLQVADAWHSPRDVTADCLASEHHIVRGGLPPDWPLQLASSGACLQLETPPSRMQLATRLSNGLPHSKRTTLCKAASSSEIAQMPKSVRFFLRNHH